MAVKVGINGFGRIGRNVLRAALGNKEIDFVAVNDLTSPATLAHLLKYDSILGNLPNEIASGEDFISVDGKKIKVWAERDPAKLPWADVGAQVVIETSGDPSAAITPRDSGARGVCRRPAELQWFPFMSIPGSHFLKRRRAFARLLCFISILLPLTEPAWAVLPPGWTDSDIGRPGLAGSAGYTNGNWTVTGGGSGSRATPINSITPAPR